jgi:hypothetical protein
VRLTIAFALLALAACNKEPTLKVQNATLEQVAAQAKQQGVTGHMRLQPGQWQIATEAKLVEAKGVPPAVVEQMKSSMQRISTSSECLTPEQAAKPSSEIFAGKQNSNCKYDRFEMGDGKIKALMHCPGGGGAEMAMTMDGTYSLTSYTMDAAMDMNAPGSGQGMKMSVHTTGTRVGECSAAAKGK